MQTPNNKFYNLLLIILVIALVICVVLLLKKDTTLNTNSLNVSQEVVSGTENLVTQKETPEKSSFSWDNLNNSEIIKLLGENNIFVDSSEPIKLTQQIDLTGDGITEGVFTGNGGNNDTSVVVIKTGDSIKLAQQKDSNGTITSVQLISLGRVKFSEKFYFTPEEKGYYTVSGSMISEETGEFSCVIQAYQWNTNLQLFVYNQALTNKYTIEACNK